MGSDEAAQRARIAELEKQVDDLNRALERSRANEELLKQERRQLRAQMRVAQEGGRLIEGMHSIALEAEQWKEKYARIIDAILDTFEIAKRDAFESGDKIRKLLPILQDSYKQGNMPYIARVMAALYSPVYEASQQETDAYKNVKLQVDHNDVYSGAICDLAGIRSNTSRARIWDLGSIILTAAYGHSQDPRVIAHLIMFECKQEGRPRINTLDALSDEWIKDNLPDASSSVAKLADGLEWAQNHRNSGIPMLTFAELHADEISDKTLRKYVSWYGVFEKLTEEPVKITEFLPIDIPEALLK